MTSHVTVQFLWIPPDLGGHRGPPFAGMRLLLRRQKYLDRFLECAPDVQCDVLAYDADLGRGTATCTFSTNADAGSIPEVEELVELLSGYRVVAIAKVVA